MSKTVKHAEMPNDSRRLDALAPRLVTVAGIIGVLGLAASVVFGFIDGWATFFRSYVLNLAYVLSFSLGALFFVILQHLTRAGWSVVVRRLAEFIAGALPLLVLLIIPVLIPVLMGMGDVYPWAAKAAEGAGHGETAELLARKSAFLNPAAFVVRCLVYAAVWSLLARYFLRNSLAQDESGDVKLTERMQFWSGISMVLFALTVTFFTFDVIMSLAPIWFSTIFGVYYFAGSMVGFFALLALSMTWLQGRGLMSHSITVEHYHDVGKLLFGFVVFWAYIAFSQYMLIWYANIPEETFWYAARQGSSWWVGVSMVLLFGHFVLPFLGLISRVPKRRRTWLMLGALWVLAAHWVDIYYLVGPQTHEYHGHAEHMKTLNVTDITLLFGLGGLFVAAVVRQTIGRSLMPERDPRLSESLAFENI